MKKFLNKIFQFRWLGSSIVNTLKKWVFKGSWSIIDQALYAGTHFLVTILLARYLDQKSFGVFAFIYSIYVLVQMGYRAFWYGPMLFYGSKKYEDKFNIYIKRLAYSHWVASFFVFLVVAVVGYLLIWFGFVKNWYLLLSVVFAFSCMLYMMFFRRACYVVLKPYIACIGSFIYGAIIVGGLVLLENQSYLSVANSFWMFSLGGLVGGIFLQSVITSGSEESETLNYTKIAKDHWSYGKWLLVAAVVTWLSGEVYYSMLVYFGFTSASGALKALMTLIKPIFHVNLGLSALLIPAFVKANDSGNKKKSLVSTLWGMGSLAILYSIVVIWFGKDILKILYGNESPYLAYGFWLIILSILPFLHTLITIFGGWLQAINKTKRFAIAYGISAISALFIGILLIPSQGLGGSVIGLVVSHVVSAIMLGLFVFKLRFNN